LLIPSDSSTSSRDSSPVISGTTSIVTVPDRQVYPRIITVPASQTLDQDILEDNVDAPADPTEGIIRDTEQTMDPGLSSSTMD